MFNAIFQGPPTSSSPAAGATPSAALDSLNGVAYYSSAYTAGWTPISAVVNKSDAKGLVANNANLLTYKATYTAAYVVSFYAVSTNTPTGATVPAFTVTYTDADSGVSVTQTSATASASAAGVVVQGSFLIRAAIGTNIVLATTSYAAGSGTALAYSANTRILFSS